MSGGMMTLETPGDKAVRMMKGFGYPHVTVTEGEGEVPGPHIYLQFDINATRTFVTIRNESPTSQVWFSDDDRERKGTLHQIVLTVHENEQKRRANGGAY